MGRPYEDEDDTGDSVVRTFGADVDPTELKWHRDDEDRTVVAIGGSDWMLQLDDALPVAMSEGVSVHIRRHEWHRLIKGTGDLRVLIRKGRQSG